MIINPSELFGNIPKDSEAFRNLPNASERKESHTLTVRESARMFEDAGVARTERSIINWCHPNKDSVSRLDCFFDTNEHKYFITSQSVALAIKEEQAKIHTGTLPNTSETKQSVPNGATPDGQLKEHTERETVEDIKKVKELEQEILDLKITNKGKDYFITQLKEDREQFVHERETFVQQLMTQNHRIGELETQLLQLEAPKRGAPRVTDRPHEYEAASYTNAEPRRHTHHDIPEDEESAITEP